MIAFHGDPAIKAKYLARVRAHAAADEIIHGTYWANGKGCAVGCTIHGSEHVQYETELGIPTAIAYLEDRMFEAQSNGASKTWPERFLNVIPVGADLSGVWPEFAAWLMDDPTHGVMYSTDDAEIKDLAAEVALRYRAGDTIGPEADELANRLWAARAARAAWAAWDARDAWDARAAWDAWDARAAWDAWDARAAWDAWDARDARAARAAWDAFVKASADHLLVLLANAPIPPQSKQEAA